ncbi:MAG: hypothetical protein OK404_01880 [Thaumarchaeota archaeon]|nr:hypothetical protein [Nitrososphaerota archaeon]
MDDEERKKRVAELPRLSLKDYVALTIAALETFLLPMIIFAVVLALIAIFFTLRL